jgi:dTMP kinase
MTEGIFITFEGGDGSGKTTQVQYLRNRLRRRRIPVRTVREPGGTPLGNKLRTLLKFSNVDMIPETEMLLFYASRIQLVRDVISPSLSRGEVIICDRFADSTFAYQGYGRSIPVNKIETIHNAVLENIKPDITIFLDLLPSEGIKRRNTSRDRFERGLEDQNMMDLHGRVRQGYMELASREPNRWLIIDAAQSKRAVSNKIWQSIEPKIHRLTDKIVG